MAERFDVAVIGGGPAGSTTALCLARKGWKVCLFEATAYQGDRWGETLPPEINPILQELGVFDEFRALEPLPSPGIVTVWGGIPQELDFLRNPYGTGWHVDRNRFDAMLCRQAEAAGARCFERCRAESAERSEGWWQVGGIEARMLVDASGRSGWRATGTIEREIEGRMLTIVFRLRCAPSDLRTYIESAPAGWWYSAPVPQGGAIAMFFTDCDLYVSEGIVPAEQLAASPLTRGRFECAEIAATRTVQVASSCAMEVAGDGWVAVGDSASSYDPLSGMGIFQAMRQGTNAAIAAEGYLRGEGGLVARYAAMVRADWGAYVERRRERYVWKGDGLAGS